MDTEQKSKIMLLTKQLDPNPRGGRELLCALNYRALKDIFGESLMLNEFPIRPVRGVRARLAAFMGHIDGLEENTLHSVVERATTGNVQKIFVDGSNLGAAVARLKISLPNIEIITFFHNVEARFFWGSFLLNKSFHAFGVLVANYLAERKAVRFSDKRICLSDRDSKLLKRLYGRGATHISPIALEDKLPHPANSLADSTGEHFCLFVGGNFYANREGIKWYARHVAPNIEIKTVVVGRGLAAMKSELDIPGKLEVIGEVDDLADWYRRSHFVIAPIFDGSGMKTKVAEALMYGKKVVGTHEAFSGYEGIANKAGWICATSEEFAAAIAIASKEINLSFFPELRLAYEQLFSYSAAATRIRKILA